ncbi:MAG: 16S rRNA (cytidine(1402)-2'-O)-methyltransferase [Chloroflexota bacterium]|nr:16S rRNA (cytidine(1402)-2'-O)-methyltransferase [Chloroflexota bacterium]
MKAHSQTMGTLYVVATPIGNLEDMTPRAVRVLREVQVIAAEDTRHTRGLLNHFSIQTPMVSYHEHNERARLERLLRTLDTGDVALVSDAGTPAISDPGAALVAAAAAAGHRVSPIPGPSAVTAAVAAAGLVTGPFLSLGFLPRRGSERRHLLARVGAAGFPVVLFESSNRVAATLEELDRAWGNRRAVVMRELTKVHEETMFGTLRELTTRTTEAEPRGEIVLVVAGRADDDLAEPGEATAVLRQMRRAGLSPSQAAREAATITGKPRSELYEMMRTLADEPGDATPAESRASDDGPGSTGGFLRRKGTPRAKKAPG